MYLKQQMKKAAFVLPVCAVAVLLTVSACKNGLGGFQKTPSGLEYKILTRGSGPQAKMGDFIQVHIIETVHDSTVFDSYKQGPEGPMWQEIQKPNGQKYDLMEGFALLHKEDSVEFVVPADSVLNVFNRPPFIKKGDKLKFYVKVLDVKDSQQYQSTLALEERAQTAKDDSVINAYMSTNHLTGTKTEDGVYVVTQTAGSGPNPQDGQEVTLWYTGKTLDGHIFDSNQDSAFHHTQPLIFTLGRGGMIPGIEEGVKTLSKGSVATLIVPSELAYGSRGKPPVIKPNTILIFDVKLTDITGNPTPNSPLGGGQK
ncbi:MAG: hypothetical protein EPN39_08540 [Chitinophagaceae bacterium]|nr:MAG: hypothetical protein EPN39_08540 [Chitinophagaceae bacterium]